MISVVANAKQLRRALKDIEVAEKNGFMHCLAVFHLKSYAEMLDQCKIEYDDLWVKTHPIQPSRDYGRGQFIEKRFQYKNGKLVPIKNQVNE